MENTPDRFLHCSTLTDACLTIYPPQPHCSRSCKSRSWRIDVHGPNATAEVNDAVFQRKSILDPLQSFKLRHLEQDIFAADRAQPDPVSKWRGSLHMVWPYFESGFGDVVMRTTVALGCALKQGELAGIEQFGVSGLKYPQLMEPLQSAGLRVCTFERESPTLPRCEQACYRRLSICEPGFAKRRYGNGRLRVTRVMGRQAWACQAALDHALGYPVPRMHEDAKGVQTRGVLRVLFSRRTGRRYLSNLDELLEHCHRDEHRIMGWSLLCSAASLGEMSQSKVVQTMRSADVFVSMHGGDMTNALRMLPGRTVLELVNCGFENAHWQWRDAFRTLLLNDKRNDDGATIVRHERLVMPPADSAHDVKVVAPGEGQGTKAPWKTCPLSDPKDRRRVELAWNADSRLPWPMLLAQLKSILSRIQ